ncbi:MAG: DNA-binding protein [Bacteroidetes bacterium 47-18]|nr:MAG: DNA-binding protein [Bacteroidetes bacterium 47-18]
MYIQEISIDIKTNLSKNELFEAFELLMSYYRGNGQTQGKIESLYIENNKIVTLPFTLKKNALDKKHNNQYVHKQIAKIEQLGGSKIKFKTVGKTNVDYKQPCTCKKPDFYILITNYVTIDSPLTCGTCNDTVPLYKLPEYYDYGYMPILSWETNYQSCDRLNMNCEVGERWALNQMENIQSQLSKQGRKICKRIEVLTGVPTFYYLHNYRRYKGDNKKRPCPSCNKKWNLKTPLHDFYDFKCDACRIVSTISTMA